MKMLQANTSTHGIDYFVQCLRLQTSPRRLTQRSNLLLKAFTTWKGKVAAPSGTGRKSKSPTAAETCEKGYVVHHPATPTDIRRTPSNGPHVKLNVVEVVDHRQERRDMPRWRKRDRSLRRERTISRRHSPRNRRRRKKQKTDVLLLENDVRRLRTASVSLYGRGTSATAGGGGSVSPLGRGDSKRVAAAWRNGGKIRGRDAAGGQREQQIEQNAQVSHSFRFHLLKTGDWSLPRQLASRLSILPTAVSQNQRHEAAHYEHDESNCGLAGEENAGRELHDGGQTTAPESRPYKKPSARNWQNGGAQNWRRTMYVKINSDLIDLVYIYGVKKVLNIYPDTRDLKKLRKTETGNPIKP